MYLGSVGNRTLWDKFVRLILTDIVQEGGYLGFLTPSSWRRPEHPLYDLMTKQNQLLYLHIYGKKDGLAKLHAQTRFDVYIIQSKRTDNGKTRIVDEKGKILDIDVQQCPFLPNFAYSLFKKWWVPKESGIDVLFSASEYDARKLSKRKTRKYRYPIVHGITKKGLQLRYANNKTKKQFGVPKVLLNFNEKQYPYNDFRGEYGMSQLTFGIPIQNKKEGDKWVQQIQDPEFEELLKATKWGAFQTDYRMFEYFPNKV